MNPRNIRKSLNDEISDADIRLLKKLFEQTKTRAEGVEIQRFRADNYSQLPRIIRLERGFMERSRRSGLNVQIYCLTFLGLSLINTARSKRYFRIMDHVVSILRKHYLRNLTKPILVRELLEEVSEFSSEDVLDSLDYLTQEHIVTGAELGFPRSENAMLIPQEGILARHPLDQILETYVGNAKTPIWSGGVPIYMQGEPDDLKKPSLMEIAHAELSTSWMSNLPQKFHPLFQEIEAGLESDQLILPCFGLRALVEMACYDKLQVAKKAKDAIKTLVSSGSLTPIEGRQLSALYRYGSSVVHSGITPTAAEVESALIVVVAMLRRLYHTQAAADQLSASLASAQKATPGVGNAVVTYFAYGSNMLTVRLKARVPSANRIGVGSLPGHKLAWHKRSSDGSGKCDIQKSDDPTDVIWGVIWEIENKHKSSLDEYEALGNGYDEADYLIEMNGGMVRAVAYFATAIDPEVKPYDWYRDLVLAGAIEHELPEAYIATIRGILVKVESDPKRLEANKIVIAKAREIIAADNAGRTK